MKGNAHKNHTNILPPGKARELAESARALAARDPYDEVAGIFRSCLSGQIAQLDISDEQVEYLTTELESRARTWYGLWLRCES